MFETGFIAKLQGSCVRLSEALREFNERGWLLDEGSALSVHNEDHYFLKFSRKGVQGVQIGANMPQFMRETTEYLLQVVEPLRDIIRSEWNRVCPRQCPQ